MISGLQEVTLSFYAMNLKGNRLGNVTYKSFIFLTSSYSLSSMAGLAHFLLLVASVPGFQMPRHLSCPAFYVEQLARLEEQPVKLQPCLLE